MIIRCGCVSEFQDRTYGKGNRVGTVVMGKSGDQKGRCTVCGKESGSTAATKTAVKK